MNRTYKEVASEAYDDLVSQGCAHKNAKAIFRAISKLLPPGDVAGDLARIGEAHSDEWSTFAEDWANRMDSEMEAIEKPAPQNGKLPKRGANGEGNE